MKTVRKLLTAMLILIYTVWTTANVVAEWEPISIDSLEVQYEKHINVSLNNEIDINALSSNDDVKILHDISVLGSDLDPADPRKALIHLDQELAKDSKYNLIAIEGADGSMDIETGSNLEWEDIYNEAGEWIESISIIDPKNIEVTFFEAITEIEISLKLFRDLPIDSLENISNTQIWVKTTEKLATSNNYIFMLIGAKNLDNSEAVIDNGIYNFETPSYLEQAPLEETVNLNAATEEVEQVVEESNEVQNQEVVSTEVITTEEVVVDNTAESVVVNETEQTSGEVTTTTQENITKAGTTDSTETHEESNIVEVAAGANNKKILE